MILKKLYLKNFLAHEETEITFSQNGITVFIGENGAGKSSIIEGITFALFGKSDKGNQSELVKWGKSQAVVELEFQKGKEIFKIERTIEIKGKRATSTGIVYKKKGNRFIPYFQKNISKEIPKLTGITNKIFNSSILVKQGDIEGLLRLSPKERGKVFEEILDMTVYQLLSEKAGEKRRDLEKEFNILLNSISDEKEINEKIRNFEEEIEKLSDKKKILEDEISKLKEDSSRLQTEIEELLNQKNKNQRIKEKIETLKNNIEKRKKDIEERKELLMKIEEKEKQLKPLEEKISALKSLEETLEKINLYEKLTEKLSALEEKEKEAQERENFLKEYETTFNQFTQKEKRLKEVQEKLNNLSKLSGQKDSFEQEIKELVEERRKSKEEAIKIAVELQNYKQIYKTLELNPVIINEFIRNNQEYINFLEKKKDEVLKKLTEVETEGKQLKKEINNLSKLEGTCPTCKRPIEEHTKKQLLDEFEKSLQEKREAYRKLKEELSSVEEKLNVEKKISPLLEQFKHFFEKHLEADKKINQLKSKLFVIEEQLKDIESIKEEKEYIEEFLNKNRDIYERFKESRRFLSKIDLKTLKKEIKNIKEKLEKLKEYITERDKEKLKAEIDELRRLERKYVAILEFVKQKETVKKDIERYEKEIRSYKKEIDILKKDVSDKEFDKEIRILKEKLFRIEKDMSGKNRDLMELNSEMGKIQGELKALKKESEKNKKIKEDLEKINKKIEKYRTVEYALSSKGIQKVIRENALYRLPKIVNVIFSAFDFPFHQVKFSDNFDISLLAPTIEKKDRYVNINSVSGGQRVALGLALRIAISRFLSNKASFLILDEPTIHLDFQRRSDLINILIELKEKSLINQLIIVTHDTEIEDAADGIYYVQGGKVRLIN